MTPTRRGTAVLAAALALGFGVGACNDREDEQTSNDGESKLQTPAYTQGTNPAQATQTQPPEQ